MAELKPCPFCGGNAKHIKLRNIAVKTKEVFYIECTVCRVRTMVEFDSDTVIEVWNRRTSEVVKVETSFYDKEEIHENCTVQVLTNTATGDVSVGWCKNEV